MAALAMHQFAEADIEEFVQERCVPAAGHVPAHRIFEEYQAWAKAKGRYQVSQHVFGRLISKRLPKALLGGRVSYMNVLLRA